MDALILQVSGIHSAKSASSRATTKLFRRVRTKANGEWSLQYSFDLHFYWFINFCHYFYLTHWFFLFAGEWLTLGIKCGFVLLPARRRRRVGFARVGWIVLICAVWHMWKHMLTFESHYLKQFFRGTPEALAKFFSWLLHLIFNR